MASKVSVKRGFSANYKMYLVFQSWHLRGQDLGHFARTKGTFVRHLKSWKEEMKMGIDKGTKASPQTAAYYRKKIAKPERELNEARVVLAVKKKVQKILADEAKKAPRKRAKGSSKRSSSA